MDLFIRTAAIEDAEDIARIDLETHIEAYRPLLGDGYLANATLEEATARWREIIPRPESEPSAEIDVLVAQRDKAIVAYSTLGPFRDDDGDGFGEVYTIYVHPAAWRTGAGEHLLQAAVARLRDRGFETVVLWVLDVNERARAFYEAQDWRHDGATKPATRPTMRFLRYRAPAPQRPASVTAGL